MNEKLKFWKYLEDPKFGYHWIWMVPTVVVLAVVTKLFDMIASLLYDVKLKWMLYRNPELKELRKLSEQDK